MTTVAGRRRPVAAAALAVVTGAALALAACGSSTPKGAGTTGTTGAGTATTTPGAPARGTYVRSWTLTSSVSGGFAEKVVLSVGTVERYAPDDRDGAFRAGTTCKLAADDGLVPAFMVLTDTSTTASPFTVGIGIDGNKVIQWQVQNPPGGPACEDTPGAGTILDVQSVTPEHPGQSYDQRFFFVLPGYYGGSHPKGDPALLNSPITVAGLATVGDGTDAQDHLSGPGAVSNGQPGFSRFTLSGAPAG